ncbi:MFS transporter [Cytophagales bacterium WSM2-2]|nr:MFS transporter [Cytophagales bacterium WSM2-2]
MEQKVKQRVFISVFFFLSGICFSTWASRIPTIKATFQYNEAELGTLLLLMPIGSLAGLPFSGWLVSRFNSRVPALAGFILVSLSLTLIGVAPSTFALAIAVCLFSFNMRILNISINVQALALQKSFSRNINGSFHGLWSTGGIVGVGISTLFVGLDISMQVHLIIISFVSIAIALFSFQYLLKGDRAASGNKINLSKPDPYVVYLGILVFLASMCEGGMFDWSGVYFKEVINVELFTLGYLIFMIFMALSRFASDSLIENIGKPKTFVISAILIFTGVSIAVLLPSFLFSLIGFCLTGMGTASLIPMVFSLAGQSKKYSPGVAISIVGTYSIAGMFLGPVLIGYVAQAFNLRIAFVTFAIAGIMLIPISRSFFRIKEKA